MNNNEIYALALTMLAGLATVFGSFIAFFAKKTNMKLLAGSLGFSAGVMIYVSMAELFIKSKEFLTLSLGAADGNAAAAAAFFAGILLIGLIDYLVPSAEGDIGNITDSCRTETLRKIGVLMAISTAIHNFPEGLVTFTSTLKDVRVGAMIALALAIHNIPEGITTTLPIYLATGSRKRAFFVTFFSGITEPLGAVLGYTVIKPFLNDTLLGVLFGIISGIMIFISIEELLPLAREYEKSKFTILSVIAGMLVMAIGLIII